MAQKTPVVNVSVGGEDDGTAFVTVDGVDYHTRNSQGSAAYAKAQTVNAHYYEDIPLNIVGPFMYGTS